MSDFLGFTQSYLQKYFDPYIENASKILNMKKHEVYESIEQYYDGFKFTINAQNTVYNPWSILNFLENPAKGFINY